MPVASDTVLIINSSSAWLQKGLSGCGGVAAAPCPSLLAWISLELSL